MGNPDIGQVNMTVATGGLRTKLGAASTAIAVFGSVPTGTTGVLRQYSDPDDAVTAHGLCAATEFASAFVDDTGASVLLFPMPIGTAGKIYTLNTDNVTGTSVVTVTGTPRDDYRLRVVAVTGGTIGTAGIVFKYSLDGGRTYTPGIALGTAVTYVLTGTGLTLNFADGTLVAADYCYCHTDGPRLDSADFADAFDALKRQQMLVKAIMVPETITKSQADDLATELATYQSSAGRETFAFVCADKPYETVTETLSVSWTAYAAGPPVVKGTVVRASGSWVDLGVKAGMRCVSTGSDQNNLTLTVDTVSALTITFSKGDTGIVLDADDADVTFVFDEPFANYQSRHRTEWDAFSFANPRVAFGAAAGKCASPKGLARWRFRRSPAWAAATVFYQYGEEISLAKVANGGVPARYSLLDSRNQLEEHDSNVEAGLASLDGSNGRAITFCQRDGFAGLVFIAVPSMAHAVGSDFVRVHYRAVMDTACRTARPALTLALASEHECNTDGTLREVDAKAVEDYVSGELRKALRAGKPKVSRVWCELRRTDQVAVPGTSVGVKIYLVPLAYLEDFDVTLSYTLEVVLPEAA